MKKASELLAYWYHKTNAPLAVLAAIFGRNESNLSKVLHGYEPSSPFTMQLRRVKSIEWHAAEGIAVVTYRVPVLRQSPLQHSKSRDQVGRQRWRHDR